MWNKNEEGEILIKKKRKEVIIYALGTLMWYTWHHITPSKAITYMHNMVYQFHTCFCCCANFFFHHSLSLMLHFLCIPDHFTLVISSIRVNMCSHLKHTRWIDAIQGTIFGISNLQAWIPSKSARWKKNMIVLFCEKTMAEKQYWQIHINLSDD